MNNDVILKRMKTITKRYAKKVYKETIINNAFEVFFERVEIIKFLRSIQNNINHFLEEFLDTKFETSYFDHDIYMRRYDFIFRSDHNNKITIAITCDSKTNRIDEVIIYYNEEITNANINEILKRARTARRCDRINNEITADERNKLDKLLYALIYNTDHYFDLFLKNKNKDISQHTTDGAVHIKNTQIPKTKNNNKPTIIITCDDKRHKIDEVIIPNE